MSLDREVPADKDKHPAIQKQKKSRLFWRLFWTFSATLLITVTILSFMMVLFVREERKNALQAELRLQARDVAQLMQQRSSLTLWPFDQSLTTALNRKLTEIRSNYDVEIWIVTGIRHVMVLGKQSYTQEQLNDAKVIEQLYKILSGEEILTQSLIGEFGKDIVTIGVPWRDMDNKPVGSVLLHISAYNLQVDYSDMIRYACIAGICALLVGTVLVFFISRRETGPLNQINQAVTDFAAGNMQRRLYIAGNDEIAELAESFNRMAEDLSNLEESRRSFVANVSHELRSPITCIQGYVQGILDGTISQAEQPKYLNVVLTETKRLTKLVGELLDLSRFESGKFPLNIAKFDINELILVEMLKFERQIEEKYITVEINFRDKPAYVAADEARIRQVVVNLIDNAVKFLDEHGELSVSTHTLDNLCYITVKDNGCGIAPEDIPFIFERFYKADKAHTSGMGTGLGLPIVKRILEQHGQTIKVSSGANGTAFTFTLPRAEE